MIKANAKLDMKSISCQTEQEVIIKKIILNSKKKKKSSYNTEK